MAIYVRENSNVVGLSFNRSGSVHLCTCEHLNKEGIMITRKQRDILILRVSLMIVREAISLDILFCLCLRHAGHD